MKKLMSERASRGLLMPALALAVVLSGSSARADNLTLGGTYNTFNFDEAGTETSVGGGSIVASSLNSVNLAWVYCVDLFDTIEVPASYTSTVTTNNGVVNGALVNGAGGVAWLLDAYANGAVADTNAQVGLQAAIWTTIYGSTYKLVSGQSGVSATAFSDYTSDLAALGTQTASLSNIDWFSPNYGSGTKYQGLVGPNISPVPEPMSIFLFGTVLLCVLTLLKRKFATGEQR